MKRCDILRCIRNVERTRYIAYNKSKPCSFSHDSETSHLSWKTSQAPKIQDKSMLNFNDWNSLIMGDYLLENQLWSHCKSFWDYSCKENPAQHLTMKPAVCGGGSSGAKNHMATRLKHFLAQNFSRTPVLMVHGNFESFIAFILWIIIGFHSFEYWRHYPSAVLPRTSLRKEEERITLEPQTDRHWNISSKPWGQEERRGRAAQSWAKGYCSGTSI